MYDEWLMCDLLPLVLSLCPYSSGSQTFSVIPHFGQGGIFKPHLPPSPQHNANEIRNKLKMFQFIEVTSCIEMQLSTSNNSKFKNKENKSAAVSKFVSSSKIEKK